MRKLPKPNEAAYQRALKKLAWALKRPDDMSWQDHLPEAPEIPENPDETVAMIVPTRKRTGRRKHLAR